MRAVLSRLSLVAFACIATWLSAAVAAQAPAASASAAAAAPVAAEQRGFDAILAAGTLRVGVHLLAPYTTHDSSGALIGSEIDIGNRLAKDMGIAADFQVYEWDQLIPALQRGEIDVIVAGMAITPQRALQVWFSAPYADSGIAMATNIQLTSGFSSLSDLDDPSVAIAVLADTVADQVVREAFENATIKTFPSEAQAEDALVKGLVHAYVRSAPAPRYLALRHPKVIDVPLSKPLLATREAFAVRKGDADFVNFLNAWIIARDADAWLTSTHKYWFESLGWQGKVQGPPVGAP